MSSNLIICNNLQSFADFVSVKIQQIEGKSVNILSNIDVIFYDTLDFKVAVMRDLISRLHNKPTDLANKYLIINNFNNFNVSAQNAFLKTLEEHTGVIFLHSINMQNILPTILIRLLVLINNLTDKSSWLECKILKSLRGAIALYLKIYK